MWVLVESNNGEQMSQHLTRVDCASSIRRLLAGMYWMYYLGSVVGKSSTESEIGFLSIGDVGAVSLLTVDVERAGTMHTILIEVRNSNISIEETSRKHSKLLMVRCFMKNPAPRSV